MKLTCDRCWKRFVTIDEPVAGRMYRIPCKCGHIIVLNLEAPATEPPPLAKTHAQPPPRMVRPRRPEPPRLSAASPVEPPAVAGAHADAASAHSASRLLLARAGREAGDAGDLARNAAAEPEPVFTRDFVLPPGDDPATPEPKRDPEQIDTRDRMLAMLDITAPVRDGTVDTPPVKRPAVEEHRDAASPESSRVADPPYHGAAVDPSDAEPIVTANFVIPDLDAVPSSQDDPFATALAATTESAAPRGGGTPPLVGDAFLAEAAARVDELEARIGGGTAAAGPRRASALATLDPTASPDDREEPRVSGVSFPTGWRAAVALQVAIFADRARMLLRYHGRLLGSTAAAAVVFYFIGAWTAAPRGGNAGAGRAGALAAASLPDARHQASSPPVREYSAGDGRDGRDGAPRRRAAAVATRRRTMARTTRAGAAPLDRAVPSTRGDGGGVATRTSIPKPAAEDVDPAASDRAAVPGSLGNAAARPVDVPAASPVTTRDAPESRATEPSAAPAPAQAATPAPPGGAAPPAQSPIEPERPARPTPTVAVPAATSTAPALAAPDVDAAAEDR